MSLDYRNYEEAKKSSTGARDGAFLMGQKTISILHTNVSTDIRRMTLRYVSSLPTENQKCVPLDSSRRIPVGSPTTFRGEE